MKQQYIEKSFYGKNAQLIRDINSIIDRYRAQGFVLSVRQVYYQLVTVNAVPNTDQSYKRVAQVLNDGRLAGLIDWDAIEDRNREIEVRARWESGAQIIDSAVRSFHRDLWTTQGIRPFVIIEKAALAGIFQSICYEWDVPLLAARGYPSVSIVRELCLQQFLPALNEGQEVQVYHFGDHDPSGLDMTRDLEERIAMFTEAEGFDAPVVTRLALNMDQIRKLKPPPNPAKTADARFEAYRKKFGHESWELDALDPSFLTRLAREAFEKAADLTERAAFMATTERIRKRLKKTADNFRKTGQ